MDLTDKEFSPVITKLGAKKILAVLAKLEAGELVPSASLATINAWTEKETSVGEVVFTTDHGPLRCYATTATGSSWEALVTSRLLLRALTTATSRRYFDMAGGDVENGVLTQITNQFRQKVGFRVETLDLGVQDANPGNTIIGIHKNGNTTPEDSNTTNPGVAPIWWRVEFATEFAADDVLAISVQPAGSGTTIHGHVYIRNIFPQ